MRLALSRAIKAFADISEVQAGDASRGAPPIESHSGYKQPSDGPAPEIDPIGMDLGENWFEHLCALAEAGSAIAQLEAGGWLFRGLGPVRDAPWDPELMGRAKIRIEPDHLRAARFLRRAAEQGIAPALEYLAEMHEQGLIAPICEIERRRWLFQSADMGSGAACAELGRCYLDGIGVAADAAEAARWFATGSEAANGLAQLELAVLYLQGHGVPRAPEKAMMLFIRARESAPELAVKFMPRLSALIADDDLCD